MPIRAKIRDDVVDICRHLVENGFECYIVGGAVRDLLLGLTPKDYDLATSATPEEVRAAFGRRRARIIGRRFRLVHVYEKNEIYEVSTFRREPTAEERRERETDDGVMLWSDNEYGTLEEDACRRDFTVNALYYDPVGGCGLVDLVDGLSDLESGIVRCIGQPGQRLEEDPVRLLRALKLVGQYGFHLENTLKNELTRRTEQIRLASDARLFEECLKILVSPFSSGVFQALHEHGLLRHYWPGLDKAWGSDLGTALRPLLEDRDRRVQTGTYSTSKALAIATVSLPYVVQTLTGVPDMSTPWPITPDTDRECRQAIRDFFEPFPISRYFTARARDIVMLAPRLAHRPPRQRYRQNPEYKYGRDILVLCIAVFGWDHTLLEPWPEPDPGERRGRRRRSSKQGRRRGGRRRKRG